VSKLDLILSDIFMLSDTEKLQIVDKVLASLHPVNKGVDAAWAQEAEERVNAFTKGNIETIETKEIFEKYDT